MVSESRLKLGAPGRYMCLYRTLLRRRLPRDRAAMASGGLDSHKFGPYGCPYTASVGVFVVEPDCHSLGIARKCSCGVTHCLDREKCQCGASYTMSRAGELLSSVRVVACGSQ